MSIYPTSIPNTSDYPDRTDNVDYIYAARYNEIKNEVIAICAELGISPSGDESTVKDRLDDIDDRGFVDRGDPSDYDFDKTDLTGDDSWYDLDLSEIIPANAKAVVLTVRLKHGDSQNYILIRKNGNSEAINIFSLFTVANVTMTGCPITALDSNRKIEYRLSAADFTSIFITVTGWFM
jgi:hypothetical protein